MSERLNEYVGFDVRERLIQLGYTTEEEIEQQIRLSEQLLDIVEEIAETEGKEKALGFINGVMVKKFMDS